MDACQYCMVFNEKSSEERHIPKTCILIVGKYICPMHIYRAHNSKGTTEIDSLFIFWINIV